MLNKLLDTALGHKQSELNLLLYWIVLSDYLRIYKDGGQRPLGIVMCLCTAATSAGVFVYERSRYLYLQGKALVPLEAAAPVGPAQNSAAIETPAAGCKRALGEDLGNERRKRTKVLEAAEANQHLQQVQTGASGLQPETPTVNHTRA